MGVWNERMERTKESMRVMSRARRDLESVFKYALGEGIEPDSFCFLVNEAAQTIVMKYVVDTKLSNHWNNDG